MRGGTSCSRVGRRHSRWRNEAAILAQSPQADGYTRPRIKKRRWKSSRRCLHTRMHDRPDGRAAVRLPVRGVHGRTAYAWIEGGRRLHADRDKPALAWCLCDWAWLAGLTGSASRFGAQDGASRYQPPRHDRAGSELRQSQPQGLIWRARSDGAHMGNLSCSRGRVVFHEDFVRGGLACQHNGLGLPARVRLERRSGPAIHLVLGSYPQIGSFSLLASCV